MINYKSPLQSDPNSESHVLLIRHVVDIINDSLENAETCHKLSSIEVYCCVNFCLGWGKNDLQVVVKRDGIAIHREGNI